MKIFCLLFLAMIIALLVESSPVGSSSNRLQKPSPKEILSKGFEVVRKDGFPGYKRSTYKLANGDKLIETSDGRWFYYDKMNTKKTYEFKGSDNGYQRVTPWKSSKLAMTKHPYLSALGISAGVGLAADAIIDD